MNRIFRDRVEAGQLLAEALSAYSGQENTIVLALPRGGVPVAYEIAQKLKLPLDVFLVRKLGVPSHEELAFGAIALGGVRVFNDDVIRQLNLNQQTIDAVIAQEQQILQERNKKYRGNKPLPDLKNCTTILVDDGIATGATIRAAIEAIRRLGCQNIIIAVPVAPRGAATQFDQLVAQIVCLETPVMFFAIGNWYENFSQTTDEEVYELLEKSHKQLVEIY